MRQPVTRHFLPTTCGALALVLVACGTAAAAPDAARIAAGREIAAKGPAEGVKACSACHGAKGEGDAGCAVPRLAGLDPGYLQAQLVAFAAGTREHDKMSAIAKALDAAAGADVSAYYASLAPPAPPVGKPNPDVAKGAALALRGDWSVTIPPCASCHGKSGHGVGAAFPAIAGQSAAYTRNQLLAWKKGSRRNDPQALMKTIADRMSDAQIAAVAAYYETLSGASTTMPAAGRGIRP